MEPQDKDEQLRQEFAKAFGWYKRKEQYSYDSELKPLTPSWEQIFVEIGRLKTYQHNLDVIENVSQRIAAIESEHHAKKDL